MPRKRKRWPPPSFGHSVDDQIPALSGLLRVGHLPEQIKSACLSECIFDFTSPESLKQFLEPVWLIILIRSQTRLGVLPRCTSGLDSSRSKLSWCSEPLQSCFLFSFQFRK
jgi:hypothetical protein